MRCFLAVPVLEPALGEAGRVLADLRERVPAVRWARPETLHLTVHFFGRADDAEVQTALDAVAPVAQGVAPFDIELNGLGSFPPRGLPRVLWLGAAAPSGELVALAERCRAALAAAGFAVETRPFRAHCTLGRPRQPWSAESRAAWNREVARAGSLGVGFRADRLLLYESVSASGGSIYVERARLGFAGP
jgi:2'-5' RNA ligase